jgi:hypothetical protein
MPRPVRLLAEPLEARDTPAVAFRFDYRFDARGFFDDPGRRALLETAAAAIAPRLQDTLSPIAPGGSNSWSVTYTNPATNQRFTLNNQAIPADTIVVYPVGAPLAGSELGEANTGLVRAVGSDNFLNQVFGRGQAGAAASPATDYGPWGGFLAFDSSTSWSFSTDAPPANQTDFLSVAQHELFHLLGFTSGAESFDRLVSTGEFTGPAVTALAGGPVPLGDDSHWGQSVTFGGQFPTMLPFIGRGELQRVTELDFAALQDIGWQVSGFTSAPITSPPATTVPPVIAGPVTTPLWSANGPPLAVGADGGDTASLLGPTLARRATAQPGGAGFAGGVRVASADVNGDGVADLIAGTGPGGPTRVVVVDGRTGTTLFSTAPFEAAFTGGVFVAAGDIDGDGRADVVVTPDRGGGPRVRVFRGSDFSVLADFLGIDDPNFRGGARAAVGDVDGDGKADVVVSAGFLGGPRIAGYRGSALAGGGVQKLFADFFAFEDTLRNGAFVALGDITGDGRAELVFGAGPGGAPRVRVIDGAGLLAAGGGVDLDARPDLGVANFFGGDSASRGGVRVAAGDYDRDGRADVVVGAGDAAGTRVTGYAGSSLRAGSAVEVFRFDAFPGAAGGVYVG